MHINVNYLHRFIVRMKIMLQLILITLFFYSSTALAQANELPDFTGLVEKHGAAVVNISAVQNFTTLNNQVVPEIPGIPENSPFYDF